MPIMNGYEAIKRIREFNEDVIIITQSILYSRTKLKSNWNGGNGYISKPIDKSKLIDHINKWPAHDIKKERIIFYSIS
jgi:CheY-like chemotaxis protein